MGKFKRFINSNYYISIQTLYDVYFSFDVSYWTLNVTYFQSGNDTLNINIMIYKSISSDNLIFLDCKLECIFFIYWISLLSFFFWWVNIKGNKIRKLPWVTCYSYVMLKECLSNTATKCHFITCVSCFLVFFIWLLN